MTSDVQGFLKDGTKASDLIRATFPPGSVTGAPKIRAVEIIHEMEREPRGVYCGCVGMFKPGGDCLLNVAIRTIVQRGSACEMGVGSGVVSDSDPEAELRETLLKGSFVRSTPMEFSLLETMLYRRGSGFVYLTEHLERMRHSAEYFGRTFHEISVQEALERAASEIESSPSLEAGEARVRLLLAKDGSATVEWADAGVPVSGPVRILLSRRRTDPRDVFLYHKTTHRGAYDRDLENAREDGFFDVLHLNDRGEITEGSITNVILCFDGEWFTPQLESGLLPGIWRARLLREEYVRERIVTLDDLSMAAQLAVGNSLRGSIEVGQVELEDGRVVWRQRQARADLPSPCGERVGYRSDHNN